MRNGRALRATCLGEFSLFFILSFSVSAAKRWGSGRVVGRAIMEGSGIMKFVSNLN